MNEIKLYGAIGYPGITSASFKSLLSDCDPSEELVVRIDSEGGSVFDGFGIYDAISTWPGKVRAIVESSAFSIASFIAMAADEVEITENGYLMLHNPWAQVEGDDAELAKQAEMLARLKQNMISVYAEKTGKTAEEIEKMMADETWLGAADAQASGLVDTVLPTARKSAAVARFKGNMPERVQLLLDASDHSSGATADQKETTLMSSNSKPVATVKSIKARFGNASPEFIVAALAAEMTDEQVAESYHSEMVKENEQLKAKLKAMEEELAGLKARAQEMTVTEVEEEDDEEEKVVLTPAAKAKPGVKPVASVAPVKPAASARQQWDQVLAGYVASGMSKPQAAKRAIREHRDLHELMLAEANQRS